MKLTTAVVNYDLANGNAIAAGAKDSLHLSPPDVIRDVARSVDLVSRVCRWGVNSSTGMPATGC